MSNDKNLEIWSSVCKTDPAHTKAANVKGNKITAIAPQSQIMAATEQFGPYGRSWGFKSIELDYSLLEKNIIIFKGIFFFPEAEFPIINSVGIYKDNACTKIDDDFAKKVETDTLTKALSKIGFNADIFMGLYDDVRYVNQMRDEFAERKPVELSDNDKQWIAAYLADKSVLEQLNDNQAYKDFIIKNAAKESK